MSSELFLSLFCRMVSSTHNKGDKMLLVSKWALIAVHYRVSLTHNNATYNNNNITKVPHQPLIIILIILYELT